MFDRMTQRFFFSANVMLLAVLLAGPVSIAAAQGGIAGSIGDVFSSVVNSATGATFTIIRIDSRTSAAPASRGEGEYVAIHFSERVKPEDLRRSLKFIPPVPLLWHGSTCETDRLGSRLPCIPVHGEPQSRSFSASCWEPVVS